MDDEQKAVSVSPCCGSARVLSSVFLWVRRKAPYKGSGRREIAEVVTCGRCCKALGALKILPAAPPEFNAEVWRQMQKKGGGDRFYCEFIDGTLQPFGGRKPLAEEVNLSPNWVAESAQALEKVEP